MPRAESSAERATRARDLRLDLPLPLTTLLGFALGIFAIAVITLMTFQSLQSRAVAVARVTETLESMQHLESVLSVLRDAQTGQRGFLLTGDEREAEPYAAAQAALPTEIGYLRALARDDAERARIDALERIALEMMETLGDTMSARRAGQIERAVEVVRSGRNRAAMERVRSLVREMEALKRASLELGQEEFRAAVVRSTRTTWAGAAVLVFLTGFAAYSMMRDHRARLRQAWVRNGQLTLTERLQGEKRLEVLGDEVLTFLAEYMDAQVGVAYVVESGGAFRRIASYAVAEDATPQQLRAGEGLAGQAVKARQLLHVTDVPDGYLNVSSGVGRARATELLVAPGVVNGVVHAVVELGFFRKVLPRHEQLLAYVSEALGTAARASKDRTRLEELLNQTQEQAEELQTQQEELRVNNEELEEQGRILRESQARLETQQAELEQINAQLEEQMQTLERRSEELSQAKGELSQRASQLEQANRYKSEFLANMSHELRTPLNSSLILAKLLADNKDGNLTAEQVKYAQTIGSAGNDLLALINDILDLSKIEAGRIELRAELLHVERTLQAMVHTVAPVAAQKGLTLSRVIEPGTPERIETDGQRLGQILKNLLSNAIKFTPRGEVVVRVFAPAPGSIAFAVRDTGIGIPPEQQGVIFDAFRQADGSTHRRYGGTGLGLSISRDLARLLGGNITVQSAAGEGSVFTLTVPTEFRAPAVRETPPPLRDDAPPPDRTESRPLRAAAPTPATLAPASVEDDREHLADSTRRLLIVEDDVRFASVLRDVAHEMHFQCVIVHSANDGLTAATLYRPHAILLDINLPDYSGLGVLDQLKRTSETRHIPVHVVSVADYSHQALERGAIGYAMKPVQREDLVAAFQKLEAKLTQSLRRVLVVEDDERQRESICRLLESDDVRVDAAATGADALRALRETTYDCVVMDLKLPDLSGYELLEKMAEQDEVSFPPVIVYTGRSLTRDEEQRLNRFSRSIIIKDARSPERLIDEVTLFLHQVEATLPLERQRMLKVARDRDAALEGRRILVVEDDARNIFALSSVLEPRGVKVEIARNGREALEALGRTTTTAGSGIDLVLMDIMMPEMDGLTAMREIRKRAEWKRLPIVALTAKAMKDDQETCLAAGANDYIAKPLDVEKLLSLVRVWMPK